MPDAISPEAAASLVFGILISMFAPKRIALAGAIMMCFVPIARAELAFWNTSIGVRPEDVMMAILTVRVGFSYVLGAGDSRRSQFLPWFAGLVALCAVSFLWAVTDWVIGRALGDPPALYVAQRMAGSTVLVWITWNICNTKSALRWVVGASILGGLIMFCLAFLGGGYDVHSYAQSDAFYAAMYDIKTRNVERLVAWNPNVVGLSFGMLLVFASTALTIWPRFLVRVLLFGSAGVFSYGLIRSYTRTSIIAAGAAGLYVVFRLVSLGYLKRTIVGIFVLGVSVAAIVAYTVDANAFRFDLGRDLNTGSRLEVWGAGANLVASHPLGLGLGRGEQGMSNEVAFDSAHNDWLDFGLSIGVLGAALALATFWRLYAECRAVTLRAPFKAPYVMAESLMVYFFVSSVALQVYTFQKQAYVGIAILVSFIHLGGVARSRSLVARVVFAPPPQGFWPQRALPVYTSPAGVRKYPVGPATTGR